MLVQNYNRQPPPTQDQDQDQDQDQNTTLLFEQTKYNQL